MIEPLSRRPGGLGEGDLYVTTRESIDEPWEPPQNLGPNVNTPYFEGQPSVSANGKTLHWDPVRPEETDATRTRKCRISRAPRRPQVDCRPKGFAEVPRVATQISKSPQPSEISTSPSIISDRSQPRRQGGRVMTIWRHFERHGVRRLEKTASTASISP
jgi:hypothetical protein